MKNVFASLCILLSVACTAQKILQTPAEFLGYTPGRQFTPHHKMIAYFKHVDSVSTNIIVKHYGKTYEGRDLIYAVISSPENFSKLESIRLDNLKRVGFENGKADDSKVGIVWLSYNVHGNEASSTEAAMVTLHELADKQNKKTQEWLKNVVVIIDPCLNPDGRERFVNYYTQYGNIPYNSNPDAIEHHEPWPTGRQNHYLFDLNRDWAWLTQQESKSRLEVYHQWMPHVHVDFHEQGHNSPYYFAPAAEPFHEVISDWQRDFQTQIGKNNAKYFDENGWLYFTKEIFDLYYPSYGDTYPTYNGAIGMTYEQAGLGYGIGVTTETGEELSLTDRISHHKTTGLSTIEITSKNVEKVINEFEKYFHDNQQNPSATYKTYVIKGDNNRDKINQFVAWLNNQKIKFGVSAVNKTTRGFDYQTQTTSNVSISPGDLIISAYQPKSRFITTVLEPVSKLPDSLTYDITAWNLIYAYDLKAFALTERINPGESFKEKRIEYADVSDKPYAYIFKYQYFKDAAFLAALLNENVMVRSAEKKFSIGNESFDPGTLIINRGNNNHIFDFDSLISTLALQHQRKIYTTATGFVDQGKDFGSGDLNLIQAPSIALLFGDQTSTLSAGALWHFFEQQLHYPITQIRTDYFKSCNLNKYHVLIVPDGYYKIFDDTIIEKITAWVSSGGRLILISNAITPFSDKATFSIRKYANDDEKNEFEKRDRDIKEKEGLPRYEDNERKQLSQYISGAIYKVSVDNSHPLAFGLSKQYFTLKTNENRFGYLPSSGWNIGVIGNNPKPVQGFAGYRANETMKKSLVFGLESYGRGQVIYLVDDPLFRSFWENGKLLFANAVFMVGQ